MSIITRPQNSSYSSGVQILVGHAVKSGLDISLESELRLTKLGVLYGDTVVLRSPKTEAVKIAHDVLRDSGLDIDTHKIRSIIHPSQHYVLDQYDLVWPQLKQSMENMAKYKVTKSRAELRSSSDYRRMKRMLDSITPRIKAMKREILRNFSISGYDQMEKLFASGTVALDSSEESFENNKVVESYIEYIFQIVNNNKFCYPLFDETTSELVRLGIKEGKLSAPSGTIKRAGQVGLSSEFIQRLSDFSSASSDEILDIRNTLSKPLKRFRSAMIECDSMINSAAWDADFPSDAEILFKSKVEPAISEIEEATAENKIFKILTKSLLVRAMESGALTFAMTHINPLNNLIGKDGVEILGVGLGLSAGTLNEYIQEGNKISKNQLYFIYKVSKML